MRGIKLQNGTVFATDGLFTVRLLSNGECTPSPIPYMVLEWDLRTENPNTWEYLTESDIKGLSNNGGEKIATVLNEARLTLEMENEKGE